MACRLVWLLNRDGPDARLCSDEAEQAVDAVDGPVSADVKAVAAGATPAVHGWAFGTVKGAAWHRPPPLDSTAHGRHHAHMPGLVPC